MQHQTVHGKPNGGAEYDRDHPAKFRGDGVDREATEGVATAAKPFVLGGLVLIRLPGPVLVMMLLMLMLMLGGRDRLLCLRQV